MSIKVYAINLKHRTDRKKHIISQFERKSEFSLTIVPAIEHNIGAFGLWQTVRQIVAIEIEKKSDYFILCEDDHTFTDSYNIDMLNQCIETASEIEADMLSGGYSWFSDAIQISEYLFWANSFNGLQFTVIFNKFYNEIMKVNHGSNVISDKVLSELTRNKFVIFPYISVQNEFGYSDVTTQNNQEGYVNGLFDYCQQKLETLVKVRNYYFKTN